MVKLHFNIKINQKAASEKLEKIGKYLVLKMQQELEAVVGKKTKFTENIKYRVEKNRVVIYTDNDVLVYIEEGTKPHIIRPKNKKALAFEAGNNYKTKSGKQVVAGDTVIVKEVKHPGTDPKPFFSPVFFKSKAVIEKFLNEK